MKFLIGLISVLLISWLALGLALPWWIIVVVAALVGWMIGENGWKSFLYGFLGIALLWGASAWMANSGNDGILAARLGELFGGLSGQLLVLLTAVIGGLAGGMGALTGSLARPQKKGRR